MSKSILITFLTLAIVTITAVAQNKSDLKNGSSAIDKKVADLMQQMTLEEKIGQMCQYVAIEHIRETKKRMKGEIMIEDDHGEMAGSHHIVLKTVPYEEAMAVPFLIAGPGIPSGVVDKNHFISGLDMLPTLCNLAGIKIPSDVRGLSVNKILKNPSASWREAVFATVDGDQERVVRTYRYKYIRLNRPDENEVLFDMQNDSGETKNLASNSEYTGILEHHWKLLNDWMKKTNDPFIKVVK